MSPPDNMPNLQLISIHSSRLWAIRFEIPRTSAFAAWPHTRLVSGRGRGRLPVASGSPHSLSALDPGHLAWCVPATNGKPSPSTVPNRRAEDLGPFDSRDAQFSAEGPASLAAEVGTDR